MLANAHVTKHINYKVRPLLVRKMGQLVNGKWEENPPSELPPNTDFRSWLTKDGSAGPDGQKGFKAEAGRYHLYLNYGCPFAHRTHIAWALKGLDKFIDLSIVTPGATPNGWSFDTKWPGTTGDKLFPEHKFIYETYLKADTNATTRCSVPVLFDTKENTVVSNESGEIIRQFDEAFDDLGAKPGNYYPKELQAQIDEKNDWVMKNIIFNYYKFKGKFASPDESVREEAKKSFFAGFDKLEAELAGSKWLLGDTLTEADTRLFVAAVRIPYGPDFGKKLQDYPNIFAWTKRFYQLPGVGATVHPDHVLAIGNLEGPPAKIDWTS